jgi:RNA polymerase sigma-70 factor, ECF subfamily
MARERRLPATGDDERQLIDAAKLDPRRFAELYEANFERVYAFVAARVRDRSEAQDVTAQVFHAALDRLRQFEWRGAPFAAWLYRIAANEIADRAKRAAREQTIDPPETAAQETFDREFDEAEERAQVFRLVKDLPDDQQRVIAMRFLEGKGIRDIAKELGRSEGAVKQLQFRALQNLRDWLGVTSPLDTKNG